MLTPRRLPVFAASAPNTEQPRSRGLLSRAYHGCVVGNVSVVRASLCDRKPGAVDDLRQPRAAAERLVANALHAGADRHARKRGAILKRQSRMLPTPSPTVTLTRAVQPKNTECPMLVTLSGIVTLTIPKQREKAELPIPVTAFPWYVLGITTFESVPIYPVTA